MQIINARIEPYNSAPKREKDGRQVIFVIRFDFDLSDLLYNARDGLRGRYWQNPDYGFLANRHILNELISPLLSFAEQTPPELIGRATRMTPEEIRNSMSGISARIWPREHSDGRTKLLLVDDHLEVKRWADAIDPKNPQKWRKSPKGAECDWEVKGALLGLNGTEYVPDVKQDRSYQIYKFGFS